MNTVAGSRKSRPVYVHSFAEFVAPVGAPAIEIVPCGTVSSFLQNSAQVETDVSSVSVSVMSVCECE